MGKAACGEISRLPKVARGIKSVNFRRTTPGTVFRAVYTSKPPPPSTVLDPTHPALSYSPYEFVRAFPWRVFPAFKLRVIPHGLLEVPSQRFSDPPYSLHTAPTKGRSVNMSLLDAAPKSVGGRVMRQDILRKFKTAISLIVVRGADTVGPEGSERLVFREDQDAQRWILPNWTYIIRPSEEVYTMPYQRLIPVLRQALQVTADAGLRLEKEWARMREAGPRPRGAKDTPKRLSMRPDEEKAARATFLNTLQRLSDLDTAPKAQGGEAAGDPAASPRASSTLSDIIRRHSKRGLTHLRDGSKSAKQD